MTYISIINAVLRRLRESEIDTASSWSGDLATTSSNGISDYQKLIGDFVNEVKQEVEDSWNWIDLRSTVSVSTVNGTRGYTLTGTNDRSRLITAYRQSDAMCLDMVADGYAHKYEFPTETSGEPTKFAYDAAVSGELRIAFEPIPDAAYDIDFRMVIPQDDLSEASDTLTVPAWPVILGTWARAIAERGEDGGTLSDLSILQYNSALSNTIAQDETRTVGETDWYAS